MKGILIYERRGILEGEYEGILMVLTGEYASMY